MDKKILGLDLGTNSIGWALIEGNFEEKKGKIIGINSRIIPMSQDILGKFDSGVSTSQTAERTGYRGIRRLYQRDTLRRERLHRILNALGFLPQHYANAIDFEKHLGQFKDGQEPKLNYKKNEDGKHQFIFMDSFQEMANEFTEAGQSSKIPLDWTIYYLRKKALSKKITKEELAWIILNFNQKRGYYQLRDEKEEDEKNSNKLVELHSLKIVDVIADKEPNNKGDLWYSLHLENGLIYRHSSKDSLSEWKGKVRDFIVTTNLNNDGSVKTGISLPKEDDWTLLKKKTEKEINDSGKTVGQYIYDTLIKKPTQKIRGKLVHTIERSFYREELTQILEKQIEYHNELQSDDLYKSCIEELYPRNEGHQNNIKDKGFTYLFLDDIIFYQRPLKSKKNTISGCQYESRRYKDPKTNKFITKGINVISKSHPLFQEFRLWQFLHNLKIYKNETKKDVDITNKLIPDEESKANLFEFLSSKKEIEQKNIVKYFVKNKTIDRKEKNNYRWNYVEDKKYPGNETHSKFLSRLKKVQGLDNPSSFLNAEAETHLWHIIYSVKEKQEYKQALSKYAKKYELDEESFKEAFFKFPAFKSDYGAYSEKAIKKLLPLMRLGKYWSANAITKEIEKRYENIMERVRHLNEEKKNYDSLADDDIPKELIKSFAQCDSVEPSAFNTYQACYLVYGRHSEVSEITCWRKPEDINKYLNNFKQHSLRNPIVEQVITETLRVVRDIWEYYGEGNKNFFDEIHVELGREMKNPADKRKRISNKNKENENTNHRIRLLLSELKNDNNIDGDIRPQSPSHQEILKIYEEGVYQNPDANYNKVTLDVIEKIRKNTDPTQKDIRKYKLWLEQGYRSPYTGKMISLGKLFTTDYEIEHIIPQSRYFDNSLSNKIICESEVNKLKSNKTAYEFLKAEGGRIVTLSGGENVTLFTIEKYEDHCAKYFKKNRAKLKKLMSEDIPEDFINRQLNDSRYISKLVKSLLGNIVREEGEKEGTPKRLVSLSGNITSLMKKDWGLNDKWNEIVAPRFKRLNKLTGSEEFGFWDKKINAFRCEVPDKLKKGFNKKRIDHRHHALDALVVACVTTNHINYLNSLNSNRQNHRLIAKLRKTEKKQITDKKTGKQKTITVGKNYLLPWHNFPAEAKEKLEGAVVSFKQNTRVINKTNNKTWQWKRQENGTLKKELIKQTKGNKWAIRKSLHQETVSGKVEIRFCEKKSFTNGIKKWEKLVDKTLKNKIKKLYAEGNNEKDIIQYFKKNPYTKDENIVKQVEIYNYKDATATRVELTDKFTRKKLESITDSGIQKILENHVKNYTDDKNKEHFNLAFDHNGIDSLNKNIQKLNNGNPHQPIYKVRVYKQGNKFNVGEKGNKATKYVGAANGTNLFFAVYWNEEKKKREFDTIPLNEVIAHQKKEANLSKEQRTTIPTEAEKGRLLFYLSPNDLVYVPTQEELSAPEKTITTNGDRIYKFTDSSEGQANFILSNIANVLFNYNKEKQKKIGIQFPIQNEVGIGSQGSKNQKAITDEMIKDICWKLKVDRLGNITKVMR